MNTKCYHISNFGSFAPEVEADANGYVTYHESERYAKASNAQLREWLGSRIKAVRNAAATEIAQRKLNQWRNSN